jgi:SAM-dependent methyltransferase
MEHSIRIDRYISLEVSAGDTTAVVGDVMRMPLRSEAVDIVICMDVLQHVEDAREALREIERVLIPGGLLILSFPFFYAECDFVDFRRWSMRGMESELRTCGLELIDSVRRGGPCFAVACALQWAAQHLIPGARKSWRLKLTFWQLTRIVFAQLLTLPAVLLAWIALAIDGCLPAGGMYMGGLMLARRVRAD